MNPFAGTCAAPLATFSSCFSANATGGCTVTNALFNDGGSGSETITYGGGASTQLSTNPNGGSLTFYGPGQKLCGSATTIASTNSVSLVLGNQVFVLGQSTITCPDGTLVMLTPSQMNAVGGCSSLALGCSGIMSADGGGSGASVSCVISQSGSPVTCMTYEDLSPSQVTQEQSNCSVETGQVVTTCPFGEVGCCTANAGTGLTKTCYYVGTVASLEPACTQQGGTWSAQ